MDIWVAFSLGIFCLHVFVFLYVYFCIYIFARDHDAKYVSYCDFRVSYSDHPVMLFSRQHTGSHLLFQTSLLRAMYRSEHHPTMQGRVWRVTLGTSCIQDHAAWSGERGFEPWWPASRVRTFFGALPCLSEVRATSTPAAIAEASLPPLGPKLDRCSLVSQGW